MSNKPVSRKNTKSIVKFTVLVDGKNVEVETNCKKFSNPVLNAKNEYQGACKKCTKKIKSACVAQNLINNPVVVKKTKSGKYIEFHEFGQKRGSMKNTLASIFESGDKTRPEINIYMKSQGYKSFGTDVYLAMKGKKSDAKRFPFKVVIDPKTSCLVYDRECPKGTWNQ